jgi:hypothetical protein
LITFIALFVYVPLFTQLEKWTREHPNVIATIKKLEREAERIDGVLYNPGTIQKIEVAKAVALGKLDVSRATLAGQIDRAFDRMEHNVDRYLDWYYSLPAEYVRLAKLMTGEIEGYMEKKLYEQLQQGEAFKEVSDAITAALASHKNVMEEYRQAIKAIMDASRLVLPPMAEAKVVNDMSLNDILSLPTHLDVVAFERRAAGGAVAAGVSAAIAAKVASKGLFKAAAKAVSKMAIAKASGILVGMGSGAVIGSVVPVIGTVIGGALGGLIGGLAVDQALLKLEELISRDEFKREMLLAIQEARVAFKARLLGTP